MNDAHLPWRLLNRVQCHRWVAGLIAVAPETLGLDPDSCLWVSLVGFEGEGTEAQHPGSLGDGMKLQGGNLASKPP